MVYAIQLWLYVETTSEAEARQHKDKLEILLKGPLVESVIRGQGIPSRGVVVLDPVLSPAK
jgi:hypothetical protein